VVAEERGAFTMHDVAAGFIAKMKARHPHLYEGGEKQNWEQMKAKKRASIVDGLPADLPALHRSFRLQDRAAGVGFDWPDIDGPIAKVDEELHEVRAEVAAAEPDGSRVNAAGAKDRLEEEIGDLLFAVVNLSRKAGVHPALALDKANMKFARRFADVERMAAERGLKVGEATLAQLDSLWDEVKTNE
jgi:MazG family protein